MAQLIVDHNSRHAIRPLIGPVWIGRARDSQLVIDEAGVLPMHAVISRDGRAYFIRNNGETWVNDQPVEGSHPLRDLDPIRVGTARLTFRNGAVTPPLLNLKQREVCPPDFVFSSETNGDAHTGTGGSAVAE